MNLDDLTEEDWDEAMRRHGETEVIGHDLAEDVDGNPLGVTEITMTGFVIPAATMEAIHNERRSG